MYLYKSLSHAFGLPYISGVLKSSNHDFKVDEIMPVQPTGEGEHLWLHIEKNGCNTDWVAQQLAQLANVKSMAVSYAGLKDRHAITRQWFSIHLPGQPDPDLTALNTDEIKILQSIRHDRKLKRGTLAGNRFQLCIRDLNGDMDELEQRLSLIREQGVPNYYGEQRFGHDMNNLSKAEALFKGGFRKLKKHQRSIYLSASRSWIFNRILSERIDQGNWNQYLAGDVFMLDGKSACFADDGSDDLLERIAAGDIHPTAALWGKGDSMAQGDCYELEQRVAAEYAVFCDGLASAGMKQERRAMRLPVAELNWALESDQKMIIEFKLPAGTYATTVLRECLDLI
ncbi:MAG: tRNA pseudouridine(13) synthase TruD [Gammaproteobacteria bacterium]|nr:tRNA pseudouridine(13) synthase TruD [Gammaproteobacteria bacterium]